MHEYHGVVGEKRLIFVALNKIDKEIGKVQTKLSNPKFTERAPAEVLDEQRERLAEWQTKHGQLTEALDNLSV